MTNSVRYIAVLLFSIAVTAAADTVRYISDNLEIALRSGKTPKHSVVKMLPSGTQVRVIQADPDGYSRVRTKEGVEGWLLTRFLSSVPSARDRLAEAEQRLAAMKIENSQLKEQMAALMAQKDQFDLRHQQWVEANRRVVQELNSIRQTAASSLALDHENKTLKGRLIQFERELQTLQQENSKLKDRAARDWFLIGAGVVILGMLIGLILPKLGPRRKPSWESF
jgi:SH3 domain protein